MLDNFHNGYIAVLMETGAIGLALFGLIYLFSGTKVLWLLANRVMSRPHYNLLVCFMSLIFLINFTETFFLGSTNLFATLRSCFCSLHAKGARQPPSRAQGTNGT